ncbi:hypothetical protein HM1_2547 [Heliomicrobium modesticaldum Ice1]|uniref:Uncharacterized protein n=1 Tax=Heliobacterium modesticaldum (strain ATCC 51547 / Ice1) TaxID=498761 RepID=B0TAX3_HELMI|nr:hypothetical protein HM1_2547 [Heliomicrobium modesticaldum Ice1]
MSYYHRVEKKPTGRGLPLPVALYPHTFKSNVRKKPGSRTK